MQHAESKTSQASMRFFSVSVLALTSSASRGCHAFRGAAAATARRASTPLLEQLGMSPSAEDGDGDGDRLRRTASRLRSEAQAAEDALRDSGARAAASRGAADRVAPAEYVDLEDSCWEISYRFANEPASEKDGGDDDAGKVPRKSYGGKLQLKFRGDGYTDALSLPGVDDGGGPTFRKLWGWDREASTEDALEYLQFSADISLPPPVSASERFYFQARVDRQGADADGNIALEEGSVTVKRDVEGPPGGWWGIFRGASSILARFRVVGSFRCRAVPRPD